MRRIQRDRRTAPAIGRQRPRAALGCIQPRLNRLCPASSEVSQERLLRMGWKPGLTGLHKVDGHDIGSGETNSFVDKDDPHAALSEVKRVLQPIHEDRWSRT